MNIHKLLFLSLAIFTAEQARASFDLLNENNQQAKAIIQFYNLNTQEKSSQTFIVPKGTAANPGKVYVFSFEYIIPVSLKATIPSMAAYSIPSLKSNVTSIRLQANGQVKADYQTSWKI